MGIHLGENDLYPIRYDFDFDLFLIIIYIDVFYEGVFFENNSI